jgi:hypothetical protein
MENMIPTGVGNSRLAALQSRKRPTVDVSKEGIAIQSGGGMSPLLTGNVDALDQGALSRVEQYGFSSPREAVSTAMDAGQRTFRTGLIDQQYERMDEEASIDRRMFEADQMHKARVGNAVGALKSRGEHDIYFSPEADRMRQTDYRYKLGLANAQQQGNVARADATEYAADADVKIARINAAGDEASDRLDGGSRALEALTTLRSGLQKPTPAKRAGLFKAFGLFGGNTPASDPDAQQRQAYDQQIARLLQSLGLSQRDGQPAPMEAGGDAQQVTGAAEPNQAAAASRADQVRTMQIQTFAQRHGIDPQTAEGILLRNGVIQ